MKFIYLLILVSSISALAQEMCQKENSPEVEDHAGKMVEILSCIDKDDSDEAAAAAAQLFLKKYESKVDFNIDVAERLLSRLQKFAESENLSNKKKSQCWLFISGVRGKLADKLRMNGGPREGKLALEALKKISSPG